MALQAEWKSVESHDCLYTAETWSKPFVRQFTEITILEKLKECHSLYKTVYIRKLIPKCNHRTSDYMWIKRSNLANFDHENTQYETKRFFFSWSLMMRRDQWVSEIWSGAIIGSFLNFKLDTTMIYSSCLQWTKAIYKAEWSENLFQVDFPWLICVTKYALSKNEIQKSNQNSKRLRKTDVLNKTVWTFIIHFHISKCPSSLQRGEAKNQTDANGYPEHKSFFSVSFQAYIFLLQRMKIMITLLD